jgi:hypothetical protein
MVPNVLQIGKYAYLCTRYRDVLCEGVETPAKKKKMATKKTVW